MKCFLCGVEALAVCAYCGKALCKSCLTSTSTQQVVCSERCQQALAEGEHIMKSLFRSKLNMTKVLVVLLFSLGALLVVTSLVVGIHENGPPMAILYFGLSGLAFLLAGTRLYRVCKDLNKPLIPLTKE